MLPALYGLRKRQTGRATSRAQMKRETASFDRSIGFNLFLLRLAGVISRGERSVERRALACLAFFCMSVYSVSYVYEFLRRDGRSNANLETFTLITSFVGVQTRFAMLLLHRGTCQTMLTECELLWSRLNSREKKVVGNYARRSNRLAITYVVNCQLTIFAYVAVALVTSWLPDDSNVARDAVNASNVSLDLENARHLPYAFFLEVRGSPWYEIACVLQFFSVTSVGLTSVGVDTTAAMFALIACGHLDVIRSRVESLRSVDSNSVQEDLRNSLIHHQVILEFCERIERCTNVILLTQMMLSTYNVSLVGFKLVGDDPNKFKYVTQLLIAVIQLLLCNWPADVLLAKSQAIAVAAYNSPWYRWSASSRTPIAVLLVRAQKPARLTAGKFVVLSLDTFGSMISTSVSFFTVVRSMN
ncbi:odorant receptor 63a [Megachile rotundata]|uniref:odorant receptor 63a n=1 Tax=Megachile rotundata TaxID=143995 RepID=UPI0006153ED2|nr:PREDICTED: putative odorant receptor 92a [Megachile rotundata]